MTPKKKFPTDELIRIVKNDPEGSNKAHRETMWQECGAMFAREFFDYWFDNNINRVLIVREPTGAITVKARTSRGEVKQLRTPRQPSPEVREQRARMAKRLADKVSRVVLMDLVMSTGKKIRDCTFAELRREGGWFLAISKLGRPNEIVGKKLTETDLFNVRMRNAA